MREVSISRGVNKVHHKVGIYGIGGVGKTELASLLGEVGVRPLFIDIEDGSSFMDVSRACPQTWDELRNILKPDQPHWGDFDAVVIDSITKAQEMAIAWTVANVKHEKGQGVSSIEGFGFGKGYSHVYDTFLQLLGDLDALHRRNKHIVCIGHECIAKVKNPSGEDWLQYQPRLHSQDNGNIRAKFKEWLDHLFFVSMDKFVEEGKATGGGTRTIYTTELPTYQAKNRCQPALPEQIDYLKGVPSLWQQILKSE